MTKHQPPRSPGSEPHGPASWIVELRERLASPRPTALETEARRLAALVPLYVDGGELWLRLVGPTGDELVPGSSTLPLEPIAAGEESFQAAGRAAAATGIEAATLLRLGALDSVPAPAGDVIVPCVAAVPPPLQAEAERAASPPVVRLPLVAARAPHLLEERRALVRGVEVWLTVAHFGPVKVAGAEVEILELLLERLFEARRSPAPERAG